MQRARLQLPLLILILGVACGRLLHLAFRPVEPSRAFVARAPEGAGVRPLLACDFEPAAQNGETQETDERVEAFVRSRKDALGLTHLSVHVQDLVSGVATGLDNHVPLVPADAGAIVWALAALHRAERVGGAVPPLTEAEMADVWASLMGDSTAALRLRSVTSQADRNARDAALARPQGLKLESVAQRARLISVLYNASLLNLEHSEAALRALRDSKAGADDGFAGEIVAYPGGAVRCGVESVPARPTLVCVAAVVPSGSPTGAAIEVSRFIREATMTRFYAASETRR